MESKGGKSLKNLTSASSWQRIWPHLNKGHQTVQMQFHFPGNLCPEPSPSQ